MNFGMANAPSSFVTMMNSIFREELGHSIVIYLDNIIVYSKNEDQHLVDLKRILIILRYNNLYAKPSKCEFFKSSLTFLGHTISNQGILADLEKIEVINKLPRPTCQKQLQSFLGLVAYVQRFIPHCSELTAPLSRLLQVDVPFMWTPECEQSIVTLKEKLTTAPILQYPDLNKVYQLETDASDKAIGAVLQIKTEDGFKPVAYKSCMLKPSEQGYSIHNKELFAIVHAIKKWQCYLEGLENIQVLTNHKSLEFFKTQSKLTRRQVKWMEKLGNYNLTLQYCPGRELLQANVLSIIYIQNAQADGDLNPDWPMYYAHADKGEYPANISTKTLKKSINQRLTLK